MWVRVSVRYRDGRKEEKKEGKKKGRRGEGKKGGSEERREGYVRCACVSGRHSSRPVLKLPREQVRSIQGLRQSEVGDTCERECKGQMEQVSSG